MVDVSTIALTEEQEIGILKIMNWLDHSSNQEFTFGGLAGCGKTSCIAYLCSVLRIPFAVSSFTGKAVSVLRRKGLTMATTLHKLMYESIYDAAKNKWNHFRRETLDVDLVIVDEASMLSRKLYDDLLSYGVKILLVGDPGQLEPVGDNPNVMAKCDYVLQTIHRQVADSNILKFAHRIRNRKPFRDEVYSEDLCVSSKDHLKYLLENEEFDAIICGKNDTRHAINKKLRKRYGYNEQGDICVGERVMCLNNNEDYNVYNGNTFVVARVGKRLKADVIEVDLRDDLDELYKCVPMRVDALGKTPERMKPDKKSVFFDYGYAMTAHKSQGSEYGRVLGVDEVVWGCDPTRWRYTTATRAKNQLVYLL